MYIRALIVGTFSLATIIGTQVAQAVDTLPGDYIAAPPGVSAVLLYGLYGRSNGAVVSGRDVSGHLDSYIGVPRLAHYTEILGVTLSVNAYMPIIMLRGAELGGASLSDASGIGDLSVASAIWLVNDPKKTRYFAIVGYLNIPSGQYDAFAPLKVGSNRWSGSGQLAGIYGLGHHWFVEGVTDITFYGDNSNYDGHHAMMAQKPTVTGQLWLVFKATDRANLSAGYGTYWGGKQTLNGSSLGFNSEKQQARVAASAFITPTLQVLWQVNHDFEVDGGFKQEFSSTIRFMKIF